MRTLWLSLLLTLSPAFGQVLWAGDTDLITTELIIDSNATPGIDAQPHVALIIDDLGDRYRDGQRVIELPVTLTVGIIPYTPYARRLAEHAALHNKEVLLHLPMQSMEERPLGKAGLRSDMSQAEFVQSLYQSLDSIGPIRGVSNHMGSQLTQDRRSMQWLMNALQLRGGLYFVDSRTIGSSQAQSVARQSGIPSASRDVFLDHDPNPLSIARQWAYTLKLARQRGSAIAIGHPYPETLAFLNKALTQLPQQNIKLVSVSELIRWRQTGGQLAWQQSRSLSR